MNRNHQFDDLITLARDSGWRVVTEKDGAGWGWYAPDGKTLLHTVQRPVGREYDNVVGRLRRAGLAIPGGRIRPMSNPGARNGAAPLTAPEPLHIIATGGGGSAPAPDVTAATLAGKEAVDAILVITDAFKQFRDHVQNELAQMRRTILQLGDAVKGQAEANVGFAQMDLDLHKAIKALREDMDLLGSSFETFEAKAKAEPAAPSVSLADLLLERLK